MIPLDVDGESSHIPMYKEYWKRKKKPKVCGTETRIQVISGIIILL